MMRPETATRILLGVSTGLLAAGGAAWLMGAFTAAIAVWTVSTVLGFTVSSWWLVSALRRRQFGVDVVAVLALAGALVIDEAFAGAVITVMLASGRWLDARATGRARRDLSLLVQRAPQTSHRRSAGGLIDVPVADVRVGDRLLVKSGEVVPVDGRLLAPATLDESALTGEPLPVARPAGDDIRSGVVNAGRPLDLLATADAASSTYAGVVRLVEQAQASSAPFVRWADRVAVVFVPVTLIVAALAWMFAGDPEAAVSVLVVATPCPLLLAAPIAMISGLSRAARAGVVIKGGSALESLATGRIVLFDKTGTLTSGHPVIAEVITAPGVDADEVLRDAASLDQVSPHVLARAIVTAAQRRGMDLSMPGDVREVPGFGLQGLVGRRRVRIGKASWTVGAHEPSWIRRARRRADLDGSITVFVTIDDRPAAALMLQDSLRPDGPRMIRTLRSAGVERVVLLTGDRADVAQMVGRLVGVDDVVADCDPSGKLAVIRRESEQGTTIMVGDGINDAPALAAATVGVALAARGASASSEAADVVLTVDRVDVIADAILTARRSRRIAVQAVAVGMGLSAAAMLVAAAGLLPPAVGAVLQEGIDILAIGIALRAVLPGKLRPVPLSDRDLATAARLQVEHERLLPLVDDIRTVADGLSERSGIARARALAERLQRDLLPHEQADQQLLVPIVDRARGGEAGSVALTRTHAEIENQVNRLGRVLAGMDDEHVVPEDMVQLRGMLYGLYAVLKLHNAQEEEGAFGLSPRTP